MLVVEPAACDSAPRPLLDCSALCRPLSPSLRMPGSCFLMTRSDTPVSRVLLQVAGGGVVQEGLWGEYSWGQVSSPSEPVSRLGLKVFSSPATPPPTPPLAEGYG